MKFRKGHKQDEAVSAAQAAEAGAAEDAAAAAEDVPAAENNTEQTGPTPEQSWPGSAETESAGEQADRIAALEDQLLRLKAEFANYRKRTERERTELATHVKVSVYREILPTLDDFDRFFRHAEDRKETLDRDLLQGIEMTHKSLVGVLQRQGVEPIQETGVPFDPHLHEAMLTGPVEDEAQDHTVIQVLEVGYRIGETMIRPARVQVGIFGGK